MPDPTSQSITVFFVSGCAENVLATFSADQCLPVEKKNKVLSAVTLVILQMSAMVLHQSFASLRKQRTKVGRRWISNIKYVAFGIFNVALAQGNTNRHYMVSKSAVALLPCMRVVVPLLVNIVSARRCRPCRAGQGEGGYGCCGEEVHGEGQ